MKYEDEYTEEDWKLIAERKTVEATQEKRRRTAMDTEGKIVKRVMRWQEENREHVREYQRQLNKRLREEGRPRKQTKATQDRATRKKSLRKARYRNERTRICKQDYINILMEEEKRRCDNLLDELEHGKRKKIVMCIIGESGAGKTLASLHLKYKLGANVICSFTTRPPRPTEEEGRDHHFIDIVPPKEELLAYTVFGGYKYYALKSQVQGPVTVYVIDEKGYLDLVDRFKDEYELHPIYITRSKILRKVAEVSESRMKRDAERALLIPQETYDKIIENNGTKAEFFDQIETIYNDLMKKSKEYGW